MAKKLLLAIPLVLVLGAATGDHSFAVKTADVAWTPLVLEGMPAGLQAKALHENPRTKMSTSIVQYPKGFHEPRHLHKSCGHYIYILKGKLGSPEGDLTAGMFTYAAPNEAHGPYTAVEPTEILFYTDGPFDFILAQIAMTRLPLCLALLSAPLFASDPLAGRIAHTDPAKYRPLKAVHAGAGEMAFTTLVPGDAFKTKFLFVHRGFLKPGGGIGHHVHSHMEEMFFILDGSAQFTINGRTSQIDGPASVPCRMSNAHAIYNNTDKPVQWMNIAVSTRKGIYDAFDLGDDRVGAPLDKIPVFISARYDKALLKPVEGNPNVLYRRALPPHVFYTDWSYVDHILVKPGAKTAKERHEGVEELYYVLRGSGNVTVDGETAPVKQDDALPVAFHEVHSFENTGSGDMELLVIGVAAEKFKVDTSIIE